MLQPPINRHTLTIKINAIAFFILLTPMFIIYLSYKLDLNNDIMV